MPFKQTRKVPPCPQPFELVAARERYNLSQAEAGALLYASGEAWSMWERGDRKMRPALWELFRRKVVELQRRRDKRAAVLAARPKPRIGRPPKPRPEVPN